MNPASKYEHMRRQISIGMLPKGPCSTLASLCSTVETSHNSVVAHDCNKLVPFVLVNVSAWTEQRTPFPRIPLFLSCCLAMALVMLTLGCVYWWPWKRVYWPLQSNKWLFWASYSGFQPSCHNMLSLLNVYIYIYIFHFCTQIIKWLL
jgi:hypothetical protein